MKKILVVDNNDSFVYNIVEYLYVNGGCDPHVIICEEVDLTTLSLYDGILLSPGAGLPSDYPNMMEIINLCRDSHSIFGVCLGFQAIVTYFGGAIVQLSGPKHGHTSRLSIVKPSDTILDAIVDGCCVGRYHSYVAEQESLPKVLEVTSKDEDGNIMSVTHRLKRVYGVQYHPESIITDNGQTMINNWVDSI